MTLLGEYLERNREGDQKQTHPGKASSLPGGGDEEESLLSTLSAPPISTNKQDGAAQQQQEEEAERPEPEAACSLDKYLSFLRHEDIEMLNERPEQLLHSALITKTIEREADAVGGPRDAVELRLRARRIKALQRMLQTVRRFAVLEQPAATRSYLESLQIADCAANSDALLATCQCPRPLEDKSKVMQVWNESQAYYKIYHFIYALTLSVRARPAQSNLKCKNSQTIDKISKIMDMVLHRANITKLDTSNKNRYGNLAFKDCMLKVPGIIRENVQKSFPNMNWALMNEVVIYFSDSWGNHQRIDYGTLHELSFFCLLFALFIGNYFEYDDFQAVVQILVYKYYRVSNQIIQRFNLEPAGNLGFLLPDQYQFLSFLFGSSELIGESQITPTDSVPITRQNEEYDYFIRSTAEDYFYFETLLTATKNKSGPFSEHSKFLWDVSRVEAWSKIYHGLLNMYRSEILQRRPMIQHFLYGGLLSSKPRDVPQVGSEAKDQNAA